jgi:hypothetical protein
MEPRSLAPCSTDMSSDSHGNGKSNHPRPAVAEWYWNEGWPTEAGHGHVGTGLRITGYEDCNHGKSLRTAGYAMRHKTSEAHAS